MSGRNRAWYQLVPAAPPMFHGYSHDVVEDVQEVIDWVSTFYTLRAPYTNVASAYLVLSSPSFHCPPTHRLPTTSSPSEPPYLSSLRHQTPWELQKFTFSKFATMPWKVSCVLHVIGAAVLQIGAVGFAALSAWIVKYDGKDIMQEIVYEVNSKRSCGSGGAVQVLTVKRA